MNELAKVEPMSMPIPAQPGGSTALVHMIERAARDQSIDLDKLERLIAMRERAEAKESERSFDRAMTAAQAAMRPVALDSSNPQTRSKYASYLALDKSLRPIYTASGFSLSFNTSNDAGPDAVRVICRVSHAEGHSVEYSIVMPADGKGAKGNDVMTRTHATGSALTYGMRYLLRLIFNVSTGDTYDDDDGNAASVQNGVISSEQVDRINQLLLDTKSNVELFLKWAGVESVSDLPAGRFNQAVKLLEAKKAKS